MKKQPRYATEAALCADFIAWVKGEGVRIRNEERGRWTAYAETEGWDILLVADDGTQIGIQAKLKFNMKVLHQSIPGSWEAWRESGPDYRAVLVPEHDGADADICGALGLMLFYPRHSTYETRPQFHPDIWDRYQQAWHYWSPRKRCELPEFVPDVIAGDSAPLQLTKWKIAALRIAATLEVRGHVTRQDFKEYSIDPRRWTGPGGWLLPGAVPGQFVRAPSLDFDAQHPTVYAQVLAEVRAKLEKRAAPLVPEALP